MLSDAELWVPLVLAVVGVIGALLGIVGCVLALFGPSTELAADPDGRMVE